MKIFTGMNINKNDKLNPIYSSSHKGSNKYYFCNTSKIITNINDNFDLNVIGTSFVNPRKESNKGFQKHLVIMTKKSLQIDKNNFITFIIENSHDCKCSLKGRLGIYRTVCANNLMVGKTFLDFRLPHSTNNFYSKLDDNIEIILKQSDKIKDSVLKGLNKEVDSFMVKRLINKAIKLRYEIPEKEFITSYSTCPIKRLDDKKNNLYDQFNRIQEAIILGGGKFLKLDKETNRFKKTSIRKITSIDKRVKLNKQLFDEYLKLVA